MSEPRYWIERDDAGFVMYERDILAADEKSPVVFGWTWAHMEGRVADEEERIAAMRAALSAWKAEQQAPDGMEAK